MVKDLLDPHHIQVAVEVVEQVLLVVIKHHHSLLLEMVEVVENQQLLEHQSFMQVVVVQGNIMTHSLVNHL